MRVAREVERSAAHVTTSQQAAIEELHRDIANVFRRCEILPIAAVRKHRPLRRTLLPFLRIYGIFNSCFVRICLVSGSFAEGSAHTSNRVIIVTERKM